MSKKILIVEDYVDMRSMMKFFIKRQGYQVIEAGDGYEAIEKVKEFSPDLILMDIAMPMMDGVTATEIIRNYYDAEKVPITALTAYSHVCHKKAIKAGFNEVIEKPIELDHFAPILKHYLH